MKNRVLNLIITGIPSIHNSIAIYNRDSNNVLNLIITGIPSILQGLQESTEICF